MPAPPREYYLDDTDGQDMKQALATIASQRHPDGSPVVMIVAPPAIQPLDLGVLTSSQSADLDGCQWRLAGWAVTEATGTARARFTIRRGADVQAPRVIPNVNLAAGESSGDEFPKGGVPCPAGVFVEVVEGQIDVVLYYREAPNG